MLALFALLLLSRVLLLLRARALLEGAQDEQGVEGAQLRTQAAAQLGLYVCVCACVCLCVCVCVWGARVGVYERECPWEGG